MHVYNPYLQHRHRRLLRQTRPHLVALCDRLEGQQKHLQRLPFLLGLLLVLLAAPLCTVAALPCAHRRSACAAVHLCGIESAVAEGRGSGAVALRGVVQDDGLVCEEELTPRAAHDGGEGDGEQRLVHRLEERHVQHLLRQHEVAPQHAERHVFAHRQLEQNLLRAAADLCVVELQRRDPVGLPLHVLAEQILHLREEGTRVVPAQRDALFNPRHVASLVCTDKPLPHEQHDALSTDENRLLVVRHSKARDGGEGQLHDRIGDVRRVDVDGARPDPDLACVFDVFPLAATVAAGGLLGAVRAQRVLHVLLAVLHAV